MQTIRYTIVPADPAAHLYEITCTITQPDPAGQSVSIPAWIPGSYMIRDFARHVQWMRAETSGRHVSIRKTDKDTWTCESISGILQLRYQVYAGDLSIRAAHLDTTHGFFNGTSVFVRVHGQERAPCEIHITRPAGDDYADWRVATALPRLAAEQHAFGSYQAANYDELIDHPVEMGRFTLAAFAACGVTHEIAITGYHYGDVERLCQDLQRICEYQIRFFGEPAPMDYYIFLITVMPEGYGGLEHRASCVLFCGREGLPRKIESRIDDNYRDFLSLASHEYFHTWHVKRIKPAAFTPYKLQQENYTRLLWAFEGITSYYEDLLLVRCGLISVDSFLELLGQKVTALLRSPGRKLQTVTESSFDAWTRFYKPDENSYNALVSYYVKGALIAFCFDIELRDASHGKKSMDDVMRILWNRYGRNNQGVAEQDMEAVIDEVAGQSWQLLHEKLLYSSEELPLAQTFLKAGIKLNLRAAAGQRDRGGRRLDTSRKQVSLGMRYSDESGYAKITHIINGGAAHRAGLSAGDIILALDGLKAGSQNLEDKLQWQQPGDPLQVHIFRRDELKVLHLELQRIEQDTAYLTLLADADETAQALRRQWLLA